MDKIKIITRLASRRMTADQFINYAKRIIVEIMNIPSQNMIVSTWDDDNDIVYYFQKSLSDFNSSNLEKIIIRDKKEDVFKNEDKEDKELRNDSESWAGFSSLIFFNFNNEVDESDISINITQGAYEQNKTALINIEFSNNFLEIITKEILVKLIKCIENTHDLIYAVVISNEFRRKVKTTGQNLWVGYMTYFNRKIDNMLVDSPLISLESGTLIDLDGDIECTALNIHKAIALRDVLAQEKLLNI